jgi:glycogen synthase
LLYHGRVDRRKGILDLLAALPAVPGARLTVSGIGPDLAAARAAAPPHVVFTGVAAYEDVPAVLRTGDVFVSPTYAEGFSNTILEAMASGLPVVAGRAVGVVDCVRDEDNGLLVEPGDVAGLGAALRRVVADEALRDRLRERALADVRATYAWPRVAARIDEIYATVARRPVREGWSAPTARPPCRFRAAPHLL